MGELNPDEVRQELSHSDLFVLASRSEGRPNALIEAVAAGLPAISSGLDGILGLVEHGVNGWVFPVEDIAALKVCLESAALSREKLRDMGRFGRQKLASGPDWAQAAKCYMGIFESALAARGAP
jgi:glycosyltransferase involved in cell wall biosynthesis